MRRPPGAVLLGLLLALPGAALAQADRPLTPRAAPTAVLPKATPVHREPKGMAPAGLAALMPLPVVPVPLSPVFVPGDPPAVEASAPASVAAAPAPAAKPKPADAPKPAHEKPAEKPAGKRIVTAKEGIYIRVAPGSNARVLDTLEAGDMAEVLPDKAEGGWVRIARNGRPLGWVAGAYLRDVKQR